MTPAPRGTSRLYVGEFEAMQDSEEPLGLELTANLARFVFGAVNVDIEIASFKARELLIRKFGIRRHSPFAARGLCERNNWRTCLTQRTEMDVGCNPLDSGRLYFPGDSLVLEDCDSRRARRGRRNRRRFFRTCQLNLDFLRLHGSDDDSYSTRYRQEKHKERAPCRNPIVH